MTTLNDSCLSCGAASFGGECDLCSDPLCDECAADSGVQDCCKKCVAEDAENHARDDAEPKDEKEVYPWG